MKKKLKRSRQIKLNLDKDRRSLYQTSSFQPLKLKLKLRILKKPLKVGNIRQILKVRKQGLEML